VLVSGMSIWAPLNYGAVVSGTILSLFVAVEFVDEFRPSNWRSRECERGTQECVRHVEVPELFERLVSIRTPSPAVSGNATC
jgi:hypothetical protein